MTVLRAYWTYSLWYNNNKNPLCRPYYTATKDATTDCLFFAGNPHFRGMRYWKGNDMAVIVVFDRNGYIAGLQAGVR